MSIGNLYRMSDAKARSISAENKTGEQGMGGRAVEGTGQSCARDLGAGWKISPSVSIPPHETVTLADVDGTGAVQSIWMAGSSDRDLVIRMYWDGCEKPSVEAPMPAFFAFLFNDNIDGTTGRFPFLNSALVMVAPNRGMNCFCRCPSAPIQNQRSRTPRTTAA